VTAKGRAVNNHATKYEQNRFGYSSTHRKIVVSVGHNGFGNQLFQHYFGYRLAQHMHAHMYVTSIDKFVPAEVPPPNTDSGASNVHLITEDAMQWDMLPPQHEARRTCRASNFTFSVRPKDHRTGRNQTKFMEDIASFLDPSEDAIRCVFIIGYFIDRNVCVRDARDMWPALVNPLPHLRRGLALGAQRAPAEASTPKPLGSSVNASAKGSRMKSLLTTVLPYHRQDMVVHMRCVVGHSTYTSNGAYKP
jgi:hypothetical protein